MVGSGGILGIKLVLIIHGSRICKFAYLLKFICNPQINTQRRFHRHLQTEVKVMKNQSGLTHVFPAETQKDHALPCSSLAWQTVLSRNMLSAILFTFVLFVGDCAA